MTRITPKERAALPKTAFAIPAQRKYPINTPTRAKAALGLVALNGTAAQKTQVRNAVKKKYGVKTFPSLKHGK